MIFLIFLLGCESVNRLKDIDQNYTLVAKIQDAKGDDNGSGSYRYPKRYFEKGDFDLVSLEIRENDDQYLFIIEILNPFTNAAKLSKGWDKQVFDIYLFNSKGTHLQALADRRVKFSSQWDKAVLVAPFGVEKMSAELKRDNTDVHDNSSEAENLVKDVIIPTDVSVRDNKLFIFIAKNKIEHIEGVQLLVMPAELASDKSIKEVTEFDNGHAFSGGSYNKTHPNVIDILGSNEKLGSFNLNTIEYAEIDMLPIKE